MTARVLALDIGDARIGVAISDPLGITAQPFSTIEQAGKRSIQNIIAIVAEQSVAKVIVGLPLELDGTVGPQAQKVQEYVGKLHAALERKFGKDKIELLYWDERLTTVAAQRVVAGSGLKNRDCRSALDRISAALILEGYLSGNAQN